MYFVPLVCDILKRTVEDVVASPHRHRPTSLNWFVSTQVTVTILIIFNVLVVQMGEEYYHARDYSKALM